MLLATSAKAFAVRFYLPLVDKHAIARSHFNAARTSRRFLSGTGISKPRPFAAGKTILLEFGDAVLITLFFREKTKARVGKVLVQSESVAYALRLHEFKADTVGETQKPLTFSQESFHSFTVKLF